MKLLKRLIYLITFVILFLLPVENRLESDVFLKLGRPFVYFYTTNAKTEGLQKDFYFGNFVFNSIIYVVLIILIRYIFKNRPSNTIQ